MTRKLTRQSATVYRRDIVKIVGQLFTNGVKWKAARLVLHGPGDVDLGGWSETGMANFICRQLKIGEPVEVPKS